MLLKIDRINFVIILFAFCFLIDSIINHFVKVPLLSASYILFLIVSFLYTKENNKIKSMFFITPFVLLFAIKINSYYLFEKDFADLLLISLMISIYYFYKSNMMKLNKIIYYIFVFMSVFLFSFSFLGIEAQSFEYSVNSTTADLNFMREYHQGLFKIPQIGSYFFMLYSILSFYLYSKTHKKQYIVIGLFLFMLTFYIGSRTPIFATLLAIMLYYIVKINIKIIFIATILIILFISFYDYILNFLMGTFLVQYITIFQILVEHSEQLSRLQLLYSFLDGVASFSQIEWLIGKSFSLSMVHNNTQLGYFIWFHNDELSIFYSYGLIGFLFYLFFLINIYIENKKSFSNLYIFTIYFTYLFYGLFNGFYYYHLFVLFYPFFYILKLQYKGNELDEN